ncbi:MAG: hypothetical protein GY762_12200 [Proteobacteria bacterium]|nr:hypothetical protein [Pseudomonadota bacterium]
MRDLKSLLTNTLLVLGLSVFVWGCEDAEKDPPFPDVVRGDYSCQYHNRYAGPDCKEYIGPTWDDVAVMVANCGSGFVEEEAVFFNERCQATQEENGVTYSLIGYCHVDIDGPEEHIVYSYDGSISNLEMACNEMQMNAEGVPGTWTTWDEEGGQQVAIRQPLPEAFDALASTSEVQVTSRCAPDDKAEACVLEMVENNETIDFMPLPLTTPVQAGFVFYPGAVVDPRSYAPTAMAFAEAGFFVSIVPMEDYMPMSGTLRADDVRALNTDISDWFVGGHSFGGSIAAQYATTNGGQTLNGLIMWDGVADKDIDLSEKVLPVLLIHTTENPVTTPEVVEEQAQYLPLVPPTEYVLIQGGDHNLFGYYEDETHATISREAQQTQVIAATVAFMEVILN